MVFIDSFSITFCSKLILATWASFSACITAFFLSVSASFSTTFCSSRAINSFVFSASLHMRQSRNKETTNKSKIYSISCKTGSPMLLLLSPRGGGGVVEMMIVYSNNFKPFYIYLHEFVVFTDRFGNLGFGDTNTMNMKTRGQLVKICLQGFFQVLINLIKKINVNLKEFNTIQI